MFRLKFLWAKLWALWANPAALAISEKMRAQITGLKAASKNVKDGVSLVKTAEGALQEVHDMLNRMDSLATQSANGTYDNDVDRANLQKEVDSLRSEIDRIADSANFNGIQLLDLCIFIFSGLFLNRFTGAALLLLVFGIAVLALLEFRRVPGGGPHGLPHGVAGGQAH